jgi:SulP family sulfate permease
LQFAVLAGILMSLTYYIMQTSVPRVYPVLPDENFRHFDSQPGKPVCPQLNILKISGDLYFGAVNHVEETIRQILNNNPGQRYLLLRMHGVNHCDISGIHMLEAITRLCRERGGDLYFMKTQAQVRALMQSTGFCDKVGQDNFLDDDIAISHLFYKALDPAVCIYECSVRAFMECQNLPKRTDSIEIPLHAGESANGIIEVSPRELRDKLRNGHKPGMVVDVREPREFREGHIPQAKLVPLGDILTEAPNWSDQKDIVLVCRSGRRSLRAAQFLRKHGCGQVSILQGGMLAWEAAGFLEAIDL